MHEVASPSELLLKQVLPASLELIVKLFSRTSELWSQENVTEVPVSVDPGAGLVIDTVEVAVGLSVDDAATY